MIVSIIGQGYVGQSLAVAAASAGHKVIGLDLNLDLIRDLKNGDSFVPGIDKKLLLKLMSKELYLPTNNFDLLAETSVIVIAVPTPIDENQQPDLSALLEACKSINRVVAEPTLVISESTSFPGTLRNIIKNSVEKDSSTSFLFAISPERVDPGNKEWKIENTPRVISGLTEQATKLAIEFYESFCSNIVKVSSPEIAEAAKLLENTFRQVNIALVNEFSEIMNKLGVSANEVVNAASSKPFGFMKFLPSIGAGGHCIPVDPEYLTYFAKSLGAYSKLTETANTLNLNRPRQVGNIIKDHLGVNLLGSQIQIVGIAYKTGVSDMRESPAIELISTLREFGAKVKWHDPIVRNWRSEVSMPLDPDVDLGLIVTPHDEIDFSVWSKAGTKVLDLSVNSKDFGWPKIL
jgi:UDP-N-acetyl-D-glucosamine dehydrogenase